MNILGRHLFGACMAEEMYDSLKDEELRMLAEREGVKNTDKFSRNELIDLLEEIWEEKLAERKQNNDIMRLKGKKYDIFREDLNGLYSEKEYIIPESYPNTSIQLLLRDPFWAYAYWDINQFDLQVMLKDNLDPQFFLRVYELSDENESLDSAISSFEIPVTAEDSSWYINLPNPGRWYQVDLIHQKESGKEIPLCRSKRMESPGGYMYDNAPAIRNNPDSFKLLLAGFADVTSDQVVDNIILQKILTEIETSTEQSLEE